MRRGHAARSADSAGAQSTTCSRLSSRISMRRSSMCSASGVCAPRVCATVGSTRSGSETAASGAHQTPSSNASPDCAVASSARRVLPAPPGPVRVTSRCSRSSRRISLSSASRPMSRDGGAGRFDALSDRNGGNTAVPSWNSFSRFAEVLEPVHAERGALERLAEQRPRALGEHHLSSVSRGADPRGPVHVEAHVAVVVDLRLAGVDPHPDGHGSARRALPGRHGRRRPRRGRP